jgi:hypothetical protein
MKNNNQFGAVNFHGAGAETEYSFLVHTETTLSNLVSDAFKLGKLDLAYILSMAMLAAKEDQMVLKSNRSIKPQSKAA